jgi:hypothetical protein
MHNGPPGPLTGERRLQKPAGHGNRGVTVTNTQRRRTLDVMTTKGGTMSDRQTSTRRPRTPPLTADQRAAEERRAADEEQSETGGVEDVRSAITLEPISA